MNITYKDSGIEWIGKIPKHWEIKQVKNLFKIGRGRVISQLELEDNGEYPVFSSQTQNNGCLGYIKTYDFDVSQLTWTTDGANAGTIFLREGKHNCTNVCGTLQLRNNDVNLKYMLYNLTHIVHYHKRQDTNGYKIMNNEMAAIKVCIPDVKEQQAIADYLDNKCGEIDNAIETEKNVIEKLKEYKQSIITETVTKGLDKSVELKDSGIEWIGKIPKHWEIISLSKISNIVRGASPRPAGDPLYFAGDFCPWITVAEVTKDESKYIFKTEEYLTELGVQHSKLIEKDTFLLSNSGATLGVPKITKIKGCINDGSLAFLEISCNKDYLYYVLKSRTNEFRKQMQGYGQPNLNTTIVKAFKICLPTRKEQQQIADYLDKKCSQIDEAIKKKEELIEKLTEYKKSLIYECVTGKRKAC